MSRERKYCIHCGAEIGDSLFCTGAECGRIPNFYRDVPNPEEKETQGSRGPARRSSKAEAVGPAPPSSRDETSLSISTAPVAVLRSLAPHSVEHFLYPGAVAIGAMPPSGIRIEQSEVSALHARLQCYLGNSGEWEFHLIDNHSTNGTYVNGNRVERGRVYPGDKIRFAHAEFELRILGETPPRLTTPMR